MYLLKDISKELVNSGGIESKRESVYRYILMHIIFIATIVVATLTSVHLLEKETAEVLKVVFYVLYGFITVDFALRIIASEDKKGYLLSFFGIVDMLSIFPMIIMLLAPNKQDVMTIFGIVTFLKLARYSPALIILKDVIISEQKPLLSALYLMLLLTFFTSTMLYFIERDINPNGFGSIPQAMWWSIVTLATLGYGDVVPMSALGKILGGMVAILGFGMFAMPAGILANGFSEEMKRLRDVASWNLVAKVPLFASLTREMVGEIAKALRIKRYINDEVIIKEGDKGNAMYFIFEGEVEVSNSRWSGVLKKGDFFGEIALLHEVPRTATVRAKGRCQLLELTAFDFRKSLSETPDVFHEIELIAQERYNVSIKK